MPSTNPFRRIPTRRQDLPGRTRRAQKRKPRPPAPCALPVGQGHEQLRWADGGRLDIPGEQDPLDSGGPAHAGRGRPAEPLDQAVVAPATGHAALRPQRVGGELEHGARVIVQAAHERGVDLVGEIGL